MTTTTPAGRTRPSDELRLAALRHFAASGFGGASLQQIADDAGYAKSSVLYHFGSKEALLEAAVAPALEALDSVVGELEASDLDADAWVRFRERFIDVLLAHRLELFTFINHRTSLVGIPLCDRTDAVIRRLTDLIFAQRPNAEDRLRFGIALGGAAYALASGMTYRGETEFAQDDVVRPALNRIVGELLQPVTAQR
ncbi:TetR/AcrR family transcriptional regulator [Agromyces sp. SYSU T00194]|uniref:TetR/AcrR family transcriptional regulator n=1 Tax=Agromyces chitinivorans TaxID=3158560 RepID=UPI003393F863